SIPYHLGNGEFGGWLPTIYLSLVASTIVGAGYIPFFGIWDLRSWNPGNDPNGNIFLGLGYVIVVALMSVVIGTLFLHEPKNVKIWDEVGGEDEPSVVARAAAPAE
ncbi:MAG TPA: hypothetical protein VGM69_00715, partial [Chloroflexota bacterium]